MIRITELADGGDQTVSGLLVEAAGMRVLVDPGASAGRDLELSPALTAAGWLDAIVLTHAHGDHTAGLGAVVAAFPAVPVWATASTLALLQARGHLTRTPSAHVRATPFYERCAVVSTRGGQPWMLRLLPAGHLLGAAMAVFETPEGCIVCSGDVSLASQYTVRRAARPRQRADVLVLESTYGDREFRPRGFEEARLVEQVSAALDRGGHVLLVVPPLGTAQEILMTLLHAKLESQLSGAVWVDETIDAVNHVFAQYAPLEYPRLSRWIAAHGNPFHLDSGLIAALPLHADRLMLDGAPAMFVTGWTAFRSGPSRSFAKAFATDSKHLILVPAQRGAQRELAEAIAPDTVRCAVGTYGIMSHADGAALAALAARWQPGFVILNHGQPEAKAALHARLTRDGLQTTVAPVGQPIGWPAGAT